MRRILTSLAVVLALSFLIPTLTKAQFKPNKNTPSISDKIGVPYSPVTSIFSFIDPSKFNMQQSYSVSFLSGGGHTGSVGLYTNRLSYTISQNLQIIADIGYLHQPFSGLGNMPLSLDKGQLLFGGELRYKPTDNSLIQLRIENAPNYMWQRNQNYSNYYSPYGYYGY